MIGALGFSIVTLLNKTEKVPIVLSPLFVALFSFCFAVTLGVIWEFYEFTFVGIFTSLLGFIMGIVFVFRKILNPAILAGYSSMMAVMLFLFGVLFMFLGLIGEYVGRIYISLNRAPQFVIKEVINAEDIKKDYE